MKKSRKNDSITPKKNVELTNQWREGQTDNSGFIGPSVCGVQYAKET